MERPAQEEYDNLTDYLQERVKMMAAAQDLVRKQCKRTYDTQLPGGHFREVKALQPGQLVLARWDLITLNTHSTKNKLMRAYTGPFQILKWEGNHYDIDMDGNRTTFHRRRLKEIMYKVDQQASQQAEGGTNEEEDDAHP